MDYELTYSIVLFSVYSGDSVIHIFILSNSFALGFIVLSKCSCVKFTFWSHFLLKMFTETDLFSVVFLNI